MHTCCKGSRVSKQTLAILDVYVVIHRLESCAQAIRAGKMPPRWHVKVIPQEAVFAGVPVRLSLPSSSLLAEFRAQSRLSDTSCFVPRFVPEI